MFNLFSIKKFNGSLMQFQDIFLRSIDSTQEYAKKNILNFGKNKITCIVADDQTHAKGRNNKTFLCEKLNNLYVTFYFELPKKTLNISSVSHVLALSLIEVLLGYDISAKIKWPNDILINEKKVSGILTELSDKKTHFNVFIGVGININSEKDFFKDLKDATSLKIETGKKFDRKQVLERLKNTFLKNLNIFIEKGFSPFYKEIENLLLYIGEDITFNDGKNTYSGKLHSITNEGFLNIYMKDKSIKTFAAGEIIKE